MKVVDKFIEVSVIRVMVNLVETGINRPKSYEDDTLVSTEIIKKGDD